MAGKEHIQNPDVIHAADRRRKGFSLTELLVTLAILAMVGSVVATAIPAASKAYKAATDASNAQVLLSTTATRLRDVLSTADPATVNNVDSDGSALTVTGVTNSSDVLVKFTDYDTGFVTFIVKDPNKGLCIAQVNKAGGAAASPNSGRPTPLVPESAAKGLDGDTMRVVPASIGWDGQTGVFTATNMQVYRGNTAFGNEAIANLKVKAITAYPDRTP